LILCIDTPLNDPDSAFSRSLSVVDFWFTFLFLIEACCKIIALGFFSNPYNGIRGYIVNWWNLLDFIVVVVSVVDFYFTMSNTGNNSNQLKSLKALRAIRALRPLRMISRNEGLKIAVKALFASIPAMANVLMIWLLFLLIFAILGVNFFKGQFYRWKVAIDSLEDLIKTRRDCLNTGGLWVNADSNFDNVLNAMLTLFQMMTKDEWIPVMDNAIDANGIEKQPIYENNVYFCLYFILFMLVGSMLVVNLFIGVIIDNFNKIKDSEEIGANWMVTPAQRQWMEVQQIMIKKKLIYSPTQPNNRFRYLWYNLCNNKKFEIGITIVIVLNTIVMAMINARMSETYATTLVIISYMFTIIYNLEFVLKFIAYFFEYFTIDSWNVFDFAWVVGADIGAILQLASVGGQLAKIAVFFRAFRIMRIFRLLRSYGQVIISTLIIVSFQITNILSLIFLLLFIYSALGINLFGAVMYREAYNSYSNFRDFPNAMILLMQVATGENWAQIMFELSKNDSYEGESWIENQTYSDMQKDGIREWGSNLSYPYFISFVIIISFTVMNLSIAAIIDGLKAAKKDEEFIITGSQIDQLVKQWNEYDPNATGWISVENLAFLIYELPPPIGLGKWVLEENYYNEKFYKSKMKDNKIESKIYRDLESQSKQKGEPITHFEVEGVKYMIHREKKIFMKETKMLQILGKFAIPVYKNTKVSFY
jgi:voltage-gated cation channel